MRKIIESQMKFGEMDISEIEFDPRSRDDIPKLLRGLQYIYCTPEVREEVFKILKNIVPESVDPNNGRKGMELWKILVLGTVRLNCNWDYDRLKEMANNHKTMRQMLGHGVFDDDVTYPMQTLKDNVSLLTPEILDEINQVVVKAGHKLIGKKKEEEEKLKGRCDSFVVETNVHYPTDINLLFDAIRKVISLISSVCSLAGFGNWRQNRHNIKKIKKAFRKVQVLKQSTSKNERKKKARQELIAQYHQDYIDLVTPFIKRVSNDISILREKGKAKEKDLQEIEKYMAHAKRQIEQIERRAIKNEVIPHHEKVFSIFEEHTEWICKGKAGITQELGLRVCVMEDQYGFILHHKVMEKQTDDKVAISIVRETLQRFSNFNSCSFDKGFYTPANKRELRILLDQVILPKKGKLSFQDQNEEYSEEFIQARHQHSAVESAINALEVHGLDRCLDHGITGFKRYAAHAVLARNIQNIGNILQKKELKRQKRREKLLKKSHIKKYRPAA